MYELIVECPVAWEKPQLMDEVSFHLGKGRIFWIREVRHNWFVTKWREWRNKLPEYDIMVDMKITFDIPFDHRVLFSESGKPCGLIKKCKYVQPNLPETNNPTPMPPVKPPRKEE